MGVSEDYLCECRNFDCLLCPAKLEFGTELAQACEIVALHCKHRIETNTFLFRAGENSERVYVLRTGLVKLTKSLPDGREQIIGLRKSGDVVGLEGITGSVYRHSAQAMSPVLACSIAYKDMLRILEWNPQVSLHTIRLLVRELDNAQTLIGDLGMKNANERIAGLIVAFAPDAGSVPTKLSIPLSRREIADLLGLGLETTSRVVAQLVREGLVKAPRGSHEWEILDFARLRRLAGR